MSTTTTLRVPLAIPSPLANTNKYTIQFSLHNTLRDTDIFIDKVYMPSDLASSGHLGTMTATLRRSELPKWSDMEEGNVVELRAHFWKGMKCVETVDCGRV